MADETKACPFCGETIKRVAVKCRFCGSMLGGAVQKLAVSLPSPPVLARPADPATEPIPIPAPPGSADSRRRLRPPLLLVALTVGAGAIAFGIGSLTKKHAEDAVPAVASASDPSPVPVTEPQESKSDRCKSILEKALLEGDCVSLSNTSGCRVPHEPCLSFSFPITMEKMVPSVRKYLQEFLKDRGYVRLRGYIVAQHEEGVYEIFRYGQRLHALLRTNQTSFSTKGNFSLWVRKVDTISVDTKDGFKQDWDVFREDDFGSLVDKVLNAPRGAQVKDAARNALRALALSSMEE